MVRAWSWMELLTFRCEVVLIQVYRQSFHQSGDRLKLGCVLWLADGSLCHSRYGNLLVPVRVPVQEAPTDAMVASDMRPRSIPWIEHPG